MSEATTPTTRKAAAKRPARGRAAGATAEAPSAEPAQPPRPSVPRAREATGQRGGLTVPVLVPEVHVQQVHVPGVRLPVPDAVSRRVPHRVGGRVIWFGGLAGLAAVGVIAWPVAGVVAAGTWAAERWARAGLRDDLSAQLAAAPGDGHAPDAAPAPDADTGTDTGTE